MMRIITLIFIIAISLGCISANDNDASTTSTTLLTSTPSTTLSETPIEINEADLTSGFISEDDTVEIGEMI